MTLKIKLYEDNSRHFMCKLYCWHGLCYNQV